MTFGCRTDYSDTLGMADEVRMESDSVDYEYVPSLGPRPSLVICRMAPRW
jgi:hypothetical protein